jgi:hypothetical protein
VAAIGSAVTNGKDAPPSTGDSRPRSGEATHAAQTDRFAERIALGYALVAPTGFKRH